MFYRWNAEREKIEGHFEDWKLHIEEVPKASRRQFRSRPLLFLSSGCEISVQGFKHVENNDRPTSLVSQQIEQD